MKKAVVLIICDLGKEEGALIELRTTNQIKKDHDTWRDHDIETEVNSNDAESLCKTITWKIRRLSSIRSSLCIMAIEGQC